MDFCVFRSEPISHLLGVDFEIRCIFVVDGLFELQVGHLLYSLGVLQFLDEFHLEHLHLHDLGFLLSNHLFFFGYLARDVLASLVHFPQFELFDLHLLVLHLFVLQPRLHLVLGCLLRTELLQSPLALFVHELSLFGFFTLVHHDCIFNFVLFSVSLFSQGGYAHAMLLLLYLLLPGLLDLAHLSLVIHFL